jgi:hypothetical protein
MPRDSALQKIESHEKLCRIMQKQTYDRMNQLQNHITGMGGVIVVLLQKL